MRKRIQCPFCFEKFQIEVFPEDGENQEMILDCEICCHPIELQIHFDNSSEKVVIEINKSTGF